jgi:hypothetical protein
VSQGHPGHKALHRGPLAVAELAISQPRDKLAAKGPRSLADGTGPELPLPRVRRAPRAVAPLLVVGAQLVLITFAQPAAEVGGGAVAVPGVAG